MRTLDETDREILRLLLEDARRPYSDIAERVDLSAPAVSDRVDRLEETGVIEGFTVRVDTDALAGGIQALLSLAVAPGDADAVYDSLAGRDRVEHAVVTADADVLALVRVPDRDIRGFIDRTVGLEHVESVSVRLVDRHEWSPGVGETDLAVDCVECDNTVTAEGESARVDGTLYHFCCASCRRNFEERYKRLEEGA